MSDGIRVTTNNFMYADPVKRLLAFLFDFVLVNFLLLLVMPGYWTDWYNLVSNLINGQSVDWVGFLTDATYIAFIAAPVVYLSLLGGFFSRTFGMMLTKIRIANMDGSRISWLKAILRAFMYIVAEIPLLLGFLPILFTAKKQGVHDMLSQTMVIIKR